MVESFLRGGGENLLQPAHVRPPQTFFAASSQVLSDFRLKCRSAAFATPLSMAFAARSTARVATAPTNAPPAAPVSAARLDEPPGGFFRLRFRLGLLGETAEPSPATGSVTLVRPTVPMALRERPAGVFPPQSSHVGWSSVPR